jgi:hypothetical protein
MSQVPVLLELAERIATAVKLVPIGSSWADVTPGNSVAHHGLLQIFAVRTSLRLSKSGMEPASGLQKNVDMRTWVRISKHQRRHLERSSVSQTLLITHITSQVAVRPVGSRKVRKEVHRRSSLVE